jgi:hypothetical protein
MSPITSPSVKIRLESLFPLKVLVDRPQHDSLSAGGIHVRRVTDNGHVNQLRLPLAPVIHELFVPNSPEELLSLAVLHHEVGYQSHFGVVDDPGRRLDFAVLLQLPVTRVPD